MGTIGFHRGIYRSNNAINLAAQTQRKVVKLLVTTNNLLDLIEKASNSATEKVAFTEKLKLKEAEVIEGVAVRDGLMLVFDNETHIVLKGVTIENLFLKKETANDTLEDFEKETGY